MPQFFWISIWIVATLLLLLLPIIVAVRTSKIKPIARQPLIKPTFDRELSAHAAESLSSAIAFQTVFSDGVNPREAGEMVRLREYLRNRYPLCHEVMEKEIVGGFSLLFRWASEAPQADPILFCAHLDVVPAAGEWTYPPFSGEIADGYVWGRGALDCKQTVVCLFETFESLIEQGFSPSRDIYLAFGHDEETGGNDGAKNIAKLFFQRGLQFEMILDEGGALTVGVANVGRPIAHVGVSEKGSINYKMSVRNQAGHAATPPRSTALGKLGEAIARVEFQQRPAVLTKIMRDHLMVLAPELPYSWRMMLANTWLFKRSLLKKLSGTPESNAQIRTTVAPTMAQSGHAPNILPDIAEATFNARLIHGDDGSKLKQYLADLTSDLGVEIEVIPLSEPSETADYSSYGFKCVERSIRAVFGDLPVAPTLLCSGTDARHYEKFSPAVLRFNPFILTPGDQQSLHNSNERVLIDALGAAISFYRDLVERMASFEPIKAVPLSDLYASLSGSGADGEDAAQN